ncbi:hypothetical protein DPMN_111511 [Dreissena polymorpha]|uniref:Uncharacterized protein n=1 Tax=Dreissena polymorpha TaxID=45954 RepID=A0A9D4KEK6_DREPO|nr:hypothetical protein DPMN_111511 [Dreissena polymorpha]
MDSRISDVTEGIPDERRQQSSDDMFGRHCYRAGRLQTATSVYPGCGRRAS